MKPVISNFTPYSFDRLLSFREAREADLAAGNTGYFRVKKPPKSKTPSKRKAKTPKPISPALQALLSSLPPDQAKEMLEALNGT